MRPFINNYVDIMDFLDDQVKYIPWDDFYGLRNMPANFIIQNELPDENLVGFLSRGFQIASAIEFGCGEGRNAIYMAKQGLTVTAFDVSSVAINTARNIANQKSTNVDFRCQDIFKAVIDCKYDLAYDSGMLHHLAPHRRITYIDLLKSILKPDGYFGLTCFSWGDNCGDEINDWEFYEKGSFGGVAFTKERLLDLFSPHFDILEIRKYKDGIANTIQGIGDFMWVCLFKNSIHL